MIVIGIDPGIERVGIGVVEFENGRFALLHSQLIKTPSGNGLPERLQQISLELDKIIKMFPADSAAVEELFFAKNVKTAMTVAQARGVILLTLQNNSIPISEYTPLQVKQSIIGYGRAVKSQVKEIVSLIIKDGVIPEQDDVVDGIAIAITHINTARTMNRINKANDKLFKR